MTRALRWPAVPYVVMRAALTGQPDGTRARGPVPGTTESCPRPSFDRIGELVDAGEHDTAPAPPQSCLR